MKPKKLFIDPQIADAAELDAIITEIDAASVVVSDPSELFKLVLSSDDPVRKGKENLYITRNKGAFIKKCPGTSHYNCCGYKILHIGTFCTMDCSYCILQAYFHPPVLQYFLNYNDLHTELENTFNNHEINRIGTGEFTDSMLWEPWTKLSDILVPKFAEQSNSILELKTKTVNIKALEKLKHNRKTIVSWSVNTDSVIKSEERNTAPLKARLEAAARCVKWGYPVSFHFDPLFIYDGCEKEYEIVIDKIFSHVSPENIAWISIGSFRFMPSLKQVIQKRFPDSKIIYGEFITGLDGKMRYFKPIRMRLYKRIVTYIKKIAPDATIYFCMEDDEIWENALGYKPSEYGGLSQILDKSAQDLCQLKLNT